MNIYEKLSAIQNELKVPKNNYNEFGKYNYRSCEDIVEAIKPLAAKHKTVLMLEDEIMLIGNRFYIKVIATLQDLEADVYVRSTAYAREEETKKGMDASQITGAASSYARKHALNGLFAIDDTRDADGLPPDKNNNNNNGKPSGSNKKPSNNKKSPDNGKTSNNKASKEQIDEILSLANEKYSDIQEFYDRLAEMEAEGSISIKYYATKKQGILWTVADCEAVKADLELPF